jgi:DNA modification methylase
MPRLQREEKGSLSEMLELNKIYNMDCLKGLKQLPDNSINCCVTSPPYWGLRDYGVEGQLGLEKTPEEYVAKMVEVFGEVKRVLRDDGTLWLNLGDCYNGSGGAGGDYNKGGLKEGQPKYPGRKVVTLKPKDLVGIPWMVAFALRADGWYLRQDIIWHKPNPMPESVKDRCTKAHEYIFLLAKSARYYYDNEAIKEDAKPESEKRYKSTFYTGKKEMSGQGRPGNASNTPGYKRWTGKRNKRSVWTVTTKPFKEAHFATFPPDLIKPCILAGCPKDGIVLDPFMGSGTTGMVAAMYQRNFIGFELNPEYCKMAEKRIEPYLMQQPIFELL